MLVEAGFKIFLPAIAPRGFTSVLLTIGFFGSINLFAVGLIGEYIAKIFEEVKHRPLFIRRSLIKDGEVRLAADRPQNVEAHK
jgi:dolichol-phosphate mannosyltransferase